MLLMIDNYDSFTYNLVQYFGELGSEVKVFRNDEITLEEISSLQPSHLCISPGPCSPAQAGISIAAIQHFAGKVDTIYSKRRGVFQGLPASFQVTRYHSLAISKETLPACLEITAMTEDEEIMGVRHKTLAVEGVQFHPESILSEYGHELLNNFLKMRI